MHDYFHTEMRTNVGRVGRSHANTRNRMCFFRSPIYYYYLLVAFAKRMWISMLAKLWICTLFGTMFGATNLLIRVVYCTLLVRLLILHAYPFAFKNHTQQTYWSTSTWTTLLCSCIRVLYYTIVDQSRSASAFIIVNFDKKTQYTNNTDVVTFNKNVRKSRRQSIQKRSQHTTPKYY